MQITAEITDSTGTLVTEYMPGGQYTVTVGAYGPAANMWIHSSAGTLAPSDDATHKAAAACPEEAAFSSAPAEMHAFLWTAPATATPVTVSIAQAAGADDFYHTAVVLFLFCCCFESCLCVECNRVKQPGFMFNVYTVAVGFTSNLKG